MRKGIHTIRDGFVANHNPTIPRRYTLDNGNYEENMRVDSVEIIWTKGRYTSPLDNLSGKPIFFVLATNELSAIPNNLTSDSYDAFALRMDDSGIIAFGVLDGVGINDVILDSDHIIPQDLYVNCWSVSSAGALDSIDNPLGFIVKMRQVKQSGAEALLAQVKETVARS